jgi:hypothetical protein
MDRAAIDKANGADRAQRSMNIAASAQTCRDPFSVDEGVCPKKQRGDTR